MKRYAAVMLCFMLTFSSLTAFSAIQWIGGNPDADVEDVEWVTGMPRIGDTTDPIGIYVGGRLIDTRVPSVLINSRTVVPLRELTEALGSTVQWNAAEGSITVTRQGTVVKMQIGNRSAFVNGARSRLELSPFLRNDVTMVPVRFLAEAFNMKVDYDGDIPAVLVYPDEHIFRPVDPGDKELAGLTRVYGSLGDCLYALLDDERLTIVVDGFVGGAGTILIDADSNAETGYQAWQWYNFGPSVKLS